MPRIAILPPEVSDQIAAGEVVERPASVVKELVENALDAGATAVTVELADGGRELIRVSDDGEGMDEADARLAVERHATSKIRRASDLVGVATYGFRGEALAAISSVSRFELETACRGSAAGVRVALRGGVADGFGAVARAPGTTITVRKLFGNVPARRKFLRSARSETRAAVEAITVLALARLDVQFTLVSDGRTLLEAPRARQVTDRLVALLGRRLVDTVIPVDHLSEYVSVRGFAQRPADAKPAGRKTFLFVNGRPFRDPFLVRAAEAGYRATIAGGLRPTLILALVLPGDRVDVNVHPSKLEVRFRDRFLVERAVEDAVRAALAPLDAAARIERPWGPQFGWQAAPAGRGGDLAEAPDGRAATLFDNAPAPAAGAGAAGPVGGSSPDAILQVFNTYLVFETPEGIAIVDQHSAHERVLYEHAMAQLTGEAAAGQRLLLPLTLDLSAEELEVVERDRELLSRVGYEVEAFGGRSVVVHAVPNPHPRFDGRRCLEELIADLARGRFGGGHNRLERFAATFGCRAAIKAGHHLEPEERRRLAAQLLACELPPHDVHGRPTIVQLPRHELERRFGRA
jgi:DNA mismatch repair protein MutL